MVNIPVTYNYSQLMAIGMLVVFFQSIYFVSCISHFRISLCFSLFTGCSGLCNEVNV